MKLPVLFTIFNRPDISVRAFECIKHYQPERLYIAADGARAHRQGEQELCERTRKAVMEQIDWPCTIQTLFRGKNIGCARAISEAISWFFEHEEWGVICEDDVVMSQDFFTLCEELLPRYKDNHDIIHITSQYYGKHREQSDTYTFGRKPFVWGWATWRRAWFDNMDMGMSAWPSYNPLRMLPVYGLFQTLTMCYYWHFTYKNINTNSSWATRWHFAAVVNRRLCICPTTNLGLNIGCTGEGGTHYDANESDPHASMKMGHLNFPLRHPKRVKLSMRQVITDNLEFMRLRAIGARKKIRKYIKRIK